jgi:hypothetical protein
MRGADEWAAATLIHGGVVNSRGADVNVRGFDVYVEPFGQFTGRGTRVEADVASRRGRRLCGARTSGRGDVSPGGYVITSRGCDA